MSKHSHQSLHAVLEQPGSRVAVHEYQSGVGYRLGKVFEVTSPGPGGTQRLLGMLRFRDHPGSKGFTERQVLEVLRHRIACHQNAVDDGEVMVDIRSKMMSHLDQISNLMAERDRQSPEEGGVL